MIQLLIGISRYFETYSWLWCLTKSLSEESCDFQFPKKKRDLQSGINFDDCKTIKIWAEDSLQFLFYFFYFSEIFFSYQFLVVLIWNLCCLTTENQIKYFCSILYLLETNFYDISCSFNCLCSPLDVFTCCLDLD